MHICDSERIEMIDFLKNRFANLNLEDYLYSGANTSCGEDIVNDKLEMATLIMDAEWAQFGCSKMVFAFKEYPNYVFKIPFRGYMDYYWDEADENFVIQGGYDFLYAGDCNINEWDYCETESYVYKKASEKGLSCFFTGTQFLAEWRGMLFYVSERALTSLTSYTEDADDNSKRRAAQMIKSSENHLFPARILAFFVQAYGESKTESLLSFLSKERLSDFHYGNMMFDSRGNIKLVDYSDFED